MDPGSLITTLGLLKQGRLQLVAKFSSRDSEMLGDMFRFERRPALMRLAIDRFNLAWVTLHNELFDAIAKTASEEAERTFKLCLLSMIERLDQAHVGDVSDEWAFVKTLIDQKKALLQAQIDFSNRHDEKYEKLIFSKHREVALFERFFAQAMKG